MYKIAICDDDWGYLELIEGEIREYCEKNQIAIGLNSYSDSDSLMDDIESGKIYDAYILDIEMREYSGIDIARAVEERSNAALIIFLTAYRDYAIDVCGMNVMRYVLKERLDKELHEVLNALFLRLDRIGNSNPYIISNQRKYIKLLQRDIIYIYKNQKNVVFVLVGKKEEEDRTTLRKVYQKIGNDEMVFLDKGIILNLYHVRRVEKGYVYMTDNHSIPSNLHHIKELKIFLQEYWGGTI